MLPIFRTISVGGVLLAITILALALTPPGGLHRQFASVRAPARGALIDRGEHPEWRQFLVRAAVQRADELSRLRELPDTPIRLPDIPDIPEIAPAALPDEASKDAPEAAPKIAGLPADRADADPDQDQTGSINTAPVATIPIEIGETSSTELPVTPAEEQPPVVMMPEHVETPEPVKPVAVSRRRAVPQRRASAPTKNQAPVPFNFLQAFFDSLVPNQPAPAKAASSTKRATANKQPAKPKRPAAIRAVSQ